MRWRLGLVLLGMSVGVAATGRLIAQTLESVRSADGRAVQELGEARTRVVVLYFVASDCPISNREFPEMRRVREEFAGQEVQFWFVYANSGERLAEVQRHQASFDAGGAAVLDGAGELTRLTGAKVTPEVSVLTRGGGGWVARYTGRVDDRYVRLGLERPRATEHFAERAIRESLDGTPVERATGTPVGCGIVSPLTATRSKP